MNKPKSVIFLVIWFMWAAGQDLDLLVRYSIKTDYYIFSASGLTVLFFVFAFGVLLLNVATVYYLFRPDPAGYYTALAALVLAIAQNVTGTVLAVRDLPGVREAYTLGREVRGLTVRVETLDKIFTPGVMYMSLGIVLIFYALVAFFVLRNRRYFRTGGLEA